MNIESSAQLSRDSDLNRHLSEQDAADRHGEWLDALADRMPDGEITNLLASAGVDDSILLATVHAMRTGNVMHLEDQWELLAAPVIRNAAMAEAELLGERP